MMSPLNIISSSALSTSSTTNSNESNRSPECSKSPPSPTLPPNPLATSAASANGKDTATSLLHAFAAGNPSMSNTLAQMFPGFPLHVAAAAAAAFYGQHPQQIPYGALYGANTPTTQQQQQQQQLSSILAAARQMTPNAFLAMQTGKKQSDLDPGFNSGNKLSPSHPMPPPSHQSPPTGFSPARSQGQQHPLMPLAMMAKGQVGGQSGHLSPQTDSSRSIPNSSASSSNNSMLSPVLFSPLSASSINDSNAFKRKLLAPNEASEVPVTSASSESAFTVANFHRMAAASRGSPLNPTGSTSSGGSGSLQCPICNISLDGVDMNAHFYEEIHKIDSLRKMAEWSAEDESKRRAELNGKDPLMFDSMTSKDLHNTNTSTSSYQKKLQLPQSRWETFQRIRQNRHTRLAAFMRLTRRKYEAAYESTLHSPSSSSGQTVAPVTYPGAHHSPSNGSVHRSPSLATANHHPQQHQQNAQSSQAFENTGFLKHEPKAAMQASLPENTAAAHSPSEGNGSSVPRTSPASMLAHQLHQHPAYPAHSLFAQNPAAAAASFLHSSALPFYPYHAAAAAAAAAGVSTHLAPFSFPPAAYGFPGSEFFATNTTTATATAPEPAATAQQPRIWRSVDTEHLESDDSERKKSDGKSRGSPNAARSTEVDVVGDAQPQSRSSSRSSHGQAEEEQKEESQEEGKKSPESYDTVMNLKKQFKAEGDGGDGDSCKLSLISDAGVEETHAKTDEDSDDVYEMVEEEEEDEDDDDVDVVSSNEEKTKRYSTATSESKAKRHRSSPTTYELYNSEAELLVNRKRGYHRNNTEPITTSAASFTTTSGHLYFGMSRTDSTETPVS